MAQYHDVARYKLTYNLKDYTALRAYVPQNPLQCIADLYYIVGQYGLAFLHSLGR